MLTGMGDLVAGRLVGGVSDENLVEGEHLLAVVEGCPDHRALLVMCGTPSDVSHQVPRRLWRVRDEGAGVTVGLWVEADDRLLGKVFRDVGDEPVLAERDDDVVGLEQEPVEV
jgi:hypothetical protein